MNEAGMGEMTPEENVTVLMVDDDEIDVRTMKRAFRKQRIANPLVRARDGEEAIHILRGTNGYEKLGYPYIILLDLNMPRLDGHEFLRKIRDDDELDQSVVFVFTTSDADYDRIRAYKRHVAGYILKQDAGDGYGDALQFLDSYCGLIQLPV